MNEKIVIIIMDETFKIKSRVFKKKFSKIIYMW